MHVKVEIIKSYKDELLMIIPKKLGDQEIDCLRKVLKPISEQERSEAIVFVLDNSQC